MTPRLLVVGGLNIDVHLFGSRSVETEPEHTAAHHEVLVGGKGANAARAAAAWGAAVAVAGAVGDDAFGREARSALEVAGIDAGGVATVGAATGLAVVRLEEGRHRTLVFSPGANEHLEADAVAAAAARWEPDIIVCQAEVPEAVSRWLAGSGHPFVYDPCPSRRALPEAMTSAVAVTPNRLEAAELTGVAEADLDPAAAARALVERGCRTVALKLGAAGTLVATADGLSRVPTLEVVARNETGAGDVFAATLAVQLASGAEAVEAASAAGIAAALAVAAPGLEFPTREDVGAVSGTGRGRVK